MIVNTLKLKGLSQAELARKMGVGPMTVSKQLKPGADVKASTIKRIAKALGVKPLEIANHWLGDSEEDDPWQN